MKLVENDEAKDELLRADVLTVLLDILVNNAAHAAVAEHALFALQALLRHEPLLARRLYYDPPLQTILAPLGHCLDDAITAEACMGVLCTLMQVEPFRKEVVKSPSLRTRLIAPIRDCLRQHRPAWESTRHNQPSDQWHKPRGRRTYAHGTWFDSGVHVTTAVRSMTVIQSLGIGVRSGKALGLLQLRRLCLLLLVALSDDPLASWQLSGSAKAFFDGRDVLDVAGGALAATLMQSVLLRRVEEATGKLQLAEAESRRLEAAEDADWDRSLKRAGLAAAHGDGPSLLAKLRAAEAELASVVEARDRTVAELEDFRRREARSAEAHAGLRLELVALTKQVEALTARMKVRDTVKTATMLRAALQARDDLQRAAGKFSRDAARMRLLAVSAQKFGTSIERHRAAVQALKSDVDGLHRQSDEIRSRTEAFKTSVAPARTRRYAALRDLEERVDVTQRGVANAEAMHLCIDALFLHQSSDECALLAVVEIKQLLWFVPSLQECFLELRVVEGLLAVLTTRACGTDLTKQTLCALGNCALYRPSYERIGELDGIAAVVRSMQSVVHDPQLQASLPPCPETPHGGRTRSASSCGELNCPLPCGEHNLQ
jgi:hypothetical protein